MKTRTDGRSFDALRPVKVQTGFQHFPEGSVIYHSGRTMVLIAASVSEGAPPWMAGKGRGWVTAEYAMHPRANPGRKERDGRRGRIDGRSQEIQRLVGRALRGAVDLDKLGERTITIDCDVLDADGGTRTASISGGYIALTMALDLLRRRGLVGPGVLRQPVAAISSGFVDDRVLLDLCYEEDSSADVDLNVVATAGGGIVEVQGTAEGTPIVRDRFDAMVEIALSGIRELTGLQQKALEEHGVDWRRLLAD